MNGRRPLCAHCTCWQTDQGAESPTVGHCHRFPPAVQINPRTGTIVQKFPTTDRNQWCGEWNGDEARLADQARKVARQHVREALSQAPPFA
jgi:hypothetical protein